MDRQTLDNANNIELGDHVRAPHFPLQNGIVVGINSMGKIGIYHCYNNGKRIDIVDDDGLVIIKRSVVEGYSGVPVDIDEMRQELIDNGEMQ